MGKITFNMGLFGFTAYSTTADLPAFYARYVEDKDYYMVIASHHNLDITTTFTFRFRDVAEGCCKRLALEAMYNWESATGRDLSFEHEQRVRQQEQLRGDIDDDELDGDPDEYYEVDEYLVYLTDEEYFS